MTENTLGDLLVERRQRDSITSAIIGLEVSL